MDDLAECEMGDGDDDTPHPTPVRRPTSFSMPEFAFVVSTKASGTEKDAKPEGGATEKDTEPVTTGTDWDDLYGDLVSPDGVVKTDITTTEDEVEPSKTDDETDPTLTSPAADSTSHAASDGTGTDANVPSCDGHSSGPQYEPYKYSYDDKGNDSVISVSVTYNHDGSVTQHSHFPAGAWDHEPAVAESDPHHEPEPEPEEEAADDDGDQDGDDGAEGQDEDGQDDYAEYDEEEEYADDYDYDEADY